MDIRVGDLIAFRKGEGKQKLGTVTGFVNFRNRPTVIVNGKWLVYPEEILGSKRFKN